MTDLKIHTSDVLEHARHARRPVLLTRRGRGVAVLLGVEEYEILVDRLAFMEAIEEGARSLDRGEVHPHREAVKILKSFGRRDA